MLSYAFQTLRESGFAKVAAEDFDNIHDLFAAILVRGVGTLVKRGLHRDYVQQKEALSGLKGQIMVSETIKRQTLSRGKLVCRYDEFLPDSPHNRALKSVMFLLLCHGNVKPGNKKSLRKLLFYFADVQAVEPAAIRWDALKYHRNNASYRMLLGLCRLTVKGLLLTEERGGHKLKAWLHDEAMHKLYECFVLSYYVRHHPEFKPKAACIDWDIDNNTKNEFLPRMETDITLQSGDRCLIIDTKYYSKTMQYNQQYDSKKFRSEHLYQIYAYVKNCDKASTGKVAGILLYAKTGEAETPDADMTIGGNRISLKTLDLNLEWEAITRQLDNLCEYLQDSEQSKSEIGYSVGQ